jgi:hypothetical protein
MAEIRGTHTWLGKTKDGHPIFMGGSKFQKLRVGHPPTTHRLQLTLEDGVRSLPRQQRLPAITTEGEKMKAAALLVTN